jgi:hypothetical protein
MVWRQNTTGAGAMHATTSERVRSSGISHAGVGASASAQ